MANICDNRFYFSCEKNFLENIKYLEKELEDYDVEIFNDYSEDGNYGDTEGTFISKWSFPTEEFERIFSKFKEEDEVYFRCLSEEYGCNYVAMNIFSDGNWWEEQTFNF